MCDATHTEHLANGNRGLETSNGPKHGADDDRRKDWPETHRRTLFGETVQRRRTVTNTGDIAAPGDQSRCASARAFATAVRSAR